MSAPTKRLKTEHHDADVDARLLHDVEIGNVYYGSPELASARERLPQLAQYAMRGQDRVHVYNVAPLVAKDNNWRLLDLVAHVAEAYADEPDVLWDVWDAIPPLMRECLAYYWLSRPDKTSIRHRGFSARFSLNEEPHVPLDVAEVRTVNLNTTKHNHTLYCV
jgi:hypothetical protein